MKISISMAAALAVVLATLPASWACEYNLNLFNHKTDGVSLRLYIEMGSIRDIIKGKMTLDPDKFDIISNPGDAEITNVATYGEVGNGLGTLMLLDRGQGMGGMQATMKRAAITYIDGMDQTDETAVFFFAEDRTEQAFASSTGDLRSRVHSEMPGDRPKPMKGRAKALYKHIIDGIDYVAEKSTRELSFVLVLTDGQEGVGAISPEQVIQAAREKRVPIFAVGFQRVWWVNNGKARIRKDNLKELQILEQIARGSGGKFVKADASDDLGGLFNRARQRVKSFVVIDSKLCGITRDQAASAGRVGAQVAYDDCRSNDYSFKLPPLEKDLGFCPKCKADADCSENEKCSSEKFICEMVSCAGCKHIENHACVEKKCAADGDCAESCSCVQGVCGAKPPCEEWQVFNEESRMCVGKSCKVGGDCPQGFECCSERCTKTKECSAWHTKEQGTCACMQVACRHDGQCPKSTWCDGEYCSDPGPNPPAASKCNDGKFAVAGECKQLDCQEDVDCELGADSAKMVCGAKVGLTKADSVKVCQEAQDGPCEPWQEKVGDFCRDVVCDKDSDCAEDASCDTESGMCGEGSSLLGKNPLLLGGIILFGMAALMFLALALRKKKVAPVPLAPSTPVSYPPAGLSPAERPKRIPTDVDMESDDHHEEPPVRSRKETDREEVSPFELSVEFSGYSKRYPLGRGPTSLGREEGDLIIPNDVVSSRHLLVDIQERGIFVQDFGSTNGTFIDSRRLAPGESVRVNLGQPVMIGTSVCLKVLAPSLQGEPNQRRRHAPTQVS